MPCGHFAGDVIVRYAGPDAHPQLMISSTPIPGSKAAKLSFKRAAVFIDRGIKRTRTKVVRVHHHKHRKRVTV